MDVALVTCRHLPEPDPDAEPLARALDQAGLDARVLAWDEPGADWSSAPVTFLRSCWNYPHHHGAFLEWADAVSRVTRLHNSLDVIRWNSHKSYLLDLETRGVPITPTALVRRGEELTLEQIMASHGWDSVVVKPAVSAASFATMRVEDRASQAGARHLRHLVAVRDVLVQEYLPSVEDYGERALVWIDGELTHAVRKSARFRGQSESVSGPVSISAEEARLALRAIESVGRPLLYGRVDLAPGRDGKPVVMELELIEPSLFFAQSSPALARYVRAVRRQVEAAGR